jgi:hypothetical protein
MGLSVSSRLAALVQSRTHERAEFVAIVDAWAREALSRGFDDWGWDADDDSLVYVIREDNTGLVKLGYSTTIYGRVGAWFTTRDETWPPRPRSLSLVCVTPGARYLEAALLHLVAPLLTSPRSEWLADSLATRLLVAVLGHPFGSIAYPIPRKVAA